MEKDRKLIYVLSATVIVLCLSIVVSLFIFFNKSETTIDKNNKENTKEVKEVKSSLEKIISLPAKEEPAIGTIQNLDNLKNNDFFKNAKIGDKIIIYTKTKKAILYRLDEQKIVNICWYSCELAYSNN